MPVASRKTQPLPPSLHTTKFLLWPPPCNSHLCPSLNLKWFPPGLPDDLIQKGKDIKGVTEIVQNGKHFKLTITTGSRVIQNEFTLGEECELEAMNGEKIKVRGVPQATFCFYTLLSWNFLPQGFHCTIPFMDTLSLNSFLGWEVGRQGQLLRKKLLVKALPFSKDCLGCSDSRIWALPIWRLQSRSLSLRFSKAQEWASGGQWKTFKRALRSSLSSK